MISDHPEVRRVTREKAMQWGTMKTEHPPRRARRLRKKIRSGFMSCITTFDFRIDRIRPHQILAINRAEEEKVLRVKVEVNERDWQEAIMMHFRPDRRSPFLSSLL
jgi:protein Tex